jgi:hypothetical protein
MPRKRKPVEADAPARAFPDELLAEAATQPGGWVYEIDPALDPDGAVPPDAIKGAWKVGDDGPTDSGEPPSE